MKNKSIKGVFLLLVSFLIIGSSFYGLYYIQKQSSDQIEVLRIKKNIVKKGDIINDSDYYIDHISKNTFKDAATLSDVKGKSYTTNMFKDSIIQKSHVSMVADNSLKLAPDECTIGLKTDLINSSGSLIEIGDTILVSGIRKAQDGLTFTMTDLGKYEVVSVKNDKGLEIKDAVKTAKDNNLISVIPAVITIKVKIADKGKIELFDDFKLFKK